MKKKIITLILSVIMLLSIFPFSVFAEEIPVTSGTCGENLTWSFNETTGILKVSGVGPMPDLDAFAYPWDEHRYNIEEVIVDNGVTSIGDCAFGWCEYLLRVTIPDSVVTIGDSAFRSCRHLTEVLIPDSVTSIGGWAFDECAYLEKVVIGDSVTSINDFTFNSCNSLCDLTIGNSVTRIGKGAFRYNYNLNNVSIPNSVTTIDDYAFYVCESLTEILFPNGLELIGEGAFCWCRSLTSVSIPENVLAIGEGAFSACFNLVSIMVDNNNHNYSNDEYGVLLNKDKTTLIQYPIGNMRTNYTIPNGVTSIGEWAFNYGDNLTSIIIPDSVMLIGDCAFWNCDNLSDVYYSGTEKDWNVVEKGDNNEMLTNATIHFNQREYNVTDTVTSSNLFKIRIDSDFDKFTGVKVDDVLVDSSNYIATEGSTIIEFKADYLETLSAGEHSVTVIFTDGIATTKFEIKNFIFSIQTPSRTEIRNKDGIILDTNIEGELPEGARVEWSWDNNKFDVEENYDGTLTIIAENNGKTTFTATIYDADGEVLAIDTVVMNSKSGFFDKIGGFFRSLFGATKVYDK